ncbi:ABC transporter ATP-binding protein [Aliiruegeria lutimaris]|uniref:Putative ABC transport system ATP-binding protein n=1 Tax=Aliiruegeria lutimaris TaxID=571298 RepID=A0A1G8M745_9RHOB|nr:ABC transporter ATP-binding protein [Aliiruegeria lutimaris]SDI63715.1 putative ABC transport system ATP-binding protein [Aliiruegeria lutimaris]
MAASETEATNAILMSGVKFAWSGAPRFGMSIAELAVPAGQTVFLLGESGSGKSTLLSLICGINQPEEGRIEIAGQDIVPMKGAARDRFRAEQIGVIFQMFNLLPYTTALDNILLPLRFAPERRRRCPDGRGEALRLAKALGLPAALVERTQAAALSTGQQQRVAVARALIGQPQLIIADEPTSALDANAQAAFLDLLFEQVQQMGATLLLVSHDIRLAERFDRRLDILDIADVRREAT